MFGSSLIHLIIYLYTKTHLFRAVELYTVVANVLNIIEMN